MNKFWLMTVAACASLAGPALADDSGSVYKPFVVLDSSVEKDGNTLANEYIGANITIGVKTANKVEYSVKAGLSLKDVPSSTSDKLSNNIEGKIKKSYDIGTFFTPYVAVRLGQKIKEDTTSFTHYAFDAGAKIPMAESLALDIGLRHRNAFDASKNYRSLRVHTTLLYELNAANTIGLRFTKSQSKNLDEERETWRLHWQHNY